jgi:hypothetical protein
MIISHKGGGGGLTVKRFRTKKDVWRIEIWRVIALEMSNLFYSIVMAKFVKECRYERSKRKSYR